MKQITVEVEEQFISFLDDDLKVLSIIPIEDLPNTLLWCHSECILGLMMEDWIDIEALYEVAFLIEEIYPNNHIQWGRTFIVVEKASFRKFQHNCLPGGNEIGITKRDLFAYGLQDTDEEISPMLSEIIAQRLVQHNLV
ncbi:MAG: hypothetical protein JXR82_01340 [Marinifilaceae bacterium]|nr:hypothetical protein [Marinifilaceae bacterium]